jgi:hypothetical protein
MWTIIWYKKKIHKILMGKLDGKEHLEEISVDVRIAIKCDVRGMGRECVDWIHVAQNKGKLRNFFCIKCGEFFD